MRGQSVFLASQLVVNQSESGAVVIMHAGVEEDGEPRAGSLLLDFLGILVDLDSDCLEQFD